MKKKVSKRQGWIVGERARNGMYWPTNVSHNSKGEVDGITGFGDLYFRCASAKEDCKALNKMWREPNAFKVFKAELRW